MARLLNPEGRVVSVPEGWVDEFLERGFHVAVDLLRPAATTAPAGITGERIKPAFPGYDALVRAGFTHLQQIQHLQFEDLTSIKGIGRVTAARILDER